MSAIGASQFGMVIEVAARETRSNTTTSVAGLWSVHATVPTSMARLWSGKKTTSVGRVLVDTLPRTVPVLASTTKRRL